GIDDLLLAALRFAATRALLRTTGGAGVFLPLRVHCLAKLLRDAHQRFGFRLQRFLRRVLVLQRRFGVVERGFDPAPFLAADLFAVFAERLLHAVDERVQTVARLHDFQQLAIFLGVRFGILHHP